MKRHLDEYEATALANIVVDWNEATRVKEGCLMAMCGRFGCDEDEARDLLNAHRTVESLAAAEGIEVHSRANCQLPWKIDLESGLVTLLAVGGAIGVSVAAMFS